MQLGPQTLQNEVGVGLLGRERGTERRHRVLVRVDQEKLELAAELERRPTAEREDSVGKDAVVRLVELLAEVLDVPLELLDSILERARVLLLLILLVALRGLVPVVTLGERRRRKSEKCARGDQDPAGYANSVLHVRGYRQNTRVSSRPMRSKSPRKGREAHVLSRR